MARPHRQRGAIAINISNIGRAIPVFAVLVLLSVGPVGTDVLGPFGRAGAATLISLVLFALPPIITNAYVGVRGVDPEIVEAARGMGMAERRIFTRVEWPLALPLVLTGLRLALVQVWATATIAALVAGPGLGNTITNGFANSRIDQVTAGAILVAVVALLLEGRRSPPSAWWTPCGPVGARTATRSAHRPSPRWSRLCDAWTGRSPAPEPDTRALARDTEGRNL
ncbi:MAG: ABC transporter permease [Nocardioidaceae bacterium]